MNTFDTTSLQFNSDCLLATPNTTINQNVSAFMQVDKNGCVQLHRDEYGLSEHGITYIKQKGDVIQLKFSAKVLRDDYLQGISINRIEQAIDNINQVASFQFDKNRIIESALVRTIDSTQMIYPNYALDVCCNSLLTLRTNHRCNVTKHKGKNKLGIVFDSSIKKEKRRMLLYAKYVLMMYGPKHASAFLKHCKNPNDIIKACKGSLRVEQAHTSFKSMRNRFKTIDNRLLSILNSVENVNYNYLLDVKNSSKQIAFEYDNYKGMPLQKVIEYKGLENMLIDFDFDIELIKAYVETKYQSSKSVYKALNKFKNALDMYKKKEMPALGESEEINNHILQLIKECA